MYERVLVMKKILIAISVVCMLMCLNMTSFAAYVGDIDGNGKITASDARMILRVSAKLDKLDDSKMNFADVNGDKKITASDARTVLRMSARLESLKELATKEITTKAPTTKAPTTKAPTTKPATTKPATTKPVTTKPAVTETTTKVPVTEAPTTEPVTEAPKSPKVTADRDKVQIYRGTSEIINVEVSNIDEYVLDVELRADDDTELSSDIKCEVEENGKKAKITLTVNEVFIGDKTMNLYVRVKKPGAKLATTYVSIPVNVCYELQEVIDGVAVEYLTDREFVYDKDTDEYILRFGLTSSASKYLSTYGRLSMRIVNNDNDVVYSTIYDLTPDDFTNWSNLYVTKYLFSMRIPAADIIEGKTEKGKVYIKLVTPWCEFNEGYISVSNLPKHSIVDDCSLELPETPRELIDYNYSGLLADSKFRVDNITYEFVENYDGTVDLILYFSGEKIYDDNGDNYSSYCHMDYKLYDAEGYVAASGYALSDKLKTGEKQKNIKDTIYYLEPGTYKLELLDRD